MMGSRPKKSGSPVPPGEGERRALSGYVPQWEFASRLVYESLAAGTLRWIGLADPKAGIFDDILLGSEGRVTGYQVKCTKKPETFRLRTLLLGAADLWSSVVDAWQKLRKQHPDCTIELVYATDNFLDNADALIEAGEQVASSAAFQRAQERYREVWTLEQWRHSAFEPFVTELQTASGLTDDEFVLLWRGFSLITGGSARLRGLSAGTVQDTNRQTILFALLPRLAASAGEKHHWTTDELLRELGWRDPFGLRHEHIFPVDSLSQSNPKSEADVRAAIEAAESGYVSLLGAPGSGKSTLLQMGLISVPDTVFLRYLAFVPGEGQGLGRAEATDFLQDLISQLKRQGLGHNLVTGEQLAELRRQLEALLREAGERFARKAVRTVIIVDGLDHIPREERPEHSLLCVLPLPHGLPKGVIFLLGSQKLELAGIPPSVRDQAGANGRRVDIAPLSRDAVYRIANASGLAAAVDRDALHARSEGHPLSVRYLIEGFLIVPTEDERHTWLRDGPSFGGNVEVFYERAWREVESDDNARRALSYLALVEGYLDPVQLDELVGRAATDQTARVALHLFKRDRDGRWSIFHNSFRQFLLEKFSFRFGRRDDGELRQRYRDLASMATRAAPNDPQRWFELRYLARAGDDDAVLALATPTRFRAQFTQQRSPSDIQADIRFAFASARTRKDVAKVFELMLCRHEIEMRAGAISAESLIDAYIDVGDLDAAMGVIAANYAGVPVDAPFKVADALLEANRPEDARKIFEQAEPIEKLLGTETVSLDHTDDVLFDWANRALIFRDTMQFNSALSHFHLSDMALRHDIPGGLDEYKRQLRLIAARSTLGASPSMDLAWLCKDLQLDAGEIAGLSVASAEIAYAWDDRELAARRLADAIGSSETVDGYQRRRAANLAFALGDFELGRRFFRGLTPPTLILNSALAGKRMISATHAIFEFAAAEQRAEEGEALRAYPEKLHGSYQRALEAVGRLFGRGRAGKIELATSVWQCIRDLMMVAAHGEGSGDWDSQRWELNNALPAIAQLALLAAKAHEPDALKLTIANIDAMIDVNPGRLGMPSFRRAFSVAAYEIEQDTKKALRRLPQRPAVEEHNTPDEFATEMCELASAQARVGDVDGARQTLTAMYENALGISRPPRKDGQYEMWQAIFVKANKADPAGRDERVRFYARLLIGLSNTEGRGSAQRMVETVMRDAAECSPQLASACFKAFDEAGIGTWAELLTATLVGVLARRPALASAVAALFNRLVLPVMDSFNRDFYPALLDAAISPQTILDRAIACVEVDADTALRYRLLEQLAELAITHGLAFPRGTLDRWRPAPEAPKSSSSSTAQDPFEGIETLDALAQALGTDGQDHDYYAGRALERLAATATYDEVKRFADLSQIKKSQGGLLAIARAAARCNARQDAERHAESLRVLIDKDGSWGSWQSGAKLRLHTLLIDLEGDVARERAFDAFAYDLSRGKEWSSSLVPDLADVFSIFADKPDWPRFFGILVSHLKEFRDFQGGSELAVPADMPATDESLLATIMISAVELMTSDLCEQVRFAARDLEDCGATGDDILVSLISGLWHRGGEFALEGTRIAWETRGSLAVDELVRANIMTLIESDDLAVMRYGMVFAATLGMTVDPPHVHMPAFYDLEIAATEGAETFEPPTGFSPRARGLWTEDPLSWTWPLERPIKLLHNATGIPIHMLRLRAAEFMRRAGGRDLFGPHATNEQDSRLRRLDLKLMFRRLSIVAAFGAVRQIGAELLRASAFPVREVPVFLESSAGPSPNFPSTPPTPRPDSISRPALPSESWTAELEKWVSEDATQPFWPEHPAGVVLAAAGEFHLTSIRQTLTEEHLFVHACDLPDDDEELRDILSNLPRAVGIGPLVPLQEGPSQSGIVAVIPDRAGTFADMAMTLCPYVAYSAGLRPDPNHPLDYLDRDGETAVRAMWWRDGGLHRRDLDRSTQGEGFIVIVSRSAWLRIRPQIEQRATIRRWRQANLDETGGRTTARRLSWTLER